MNELCEALEVSSSGYYKWHRSEIGPRELENRCLLEEMRKIHAHRHTRAYGSPRMTLELRERGLPCSENRVAALMAREGLYARGRRAFRPKTTQSDRHAVPTPNRLAEAPSARVPGEALVSDITYVATTERDGFISRSLSISSAERCSAGRSAKASKLVSSLTPSRELWRHATRRPRRSSIRIEGVSIPAGSSDHLWSTTVSSRA